MDIRGDIRGFIESTFFPNAFDDTDSFHKTGMIDSNGMFEIVTFLEQHFEITIHSSELTPDNLDSVANLVRFVERKRRPTMS